MASICVLLFVLLFGLASANPSEWCPNKGIFEFLPLHVGNAPLVGDLKWEGICFQQNTAHIYFNSTHLTFVLNSQAAHSHTCEDTYIIASRASVFDIHTKYFTGETKIGFKVSAEDRIFIEKHGVPVFILPCQIEGTAASLIKTAESILGSAQKARDESTEFLFKKMRGWEKLAGPGQLKINKNDIRSGDQFTMMSPGWNAGLICWMHGGRSDHSLMALWDKTHTELYVLEMLGYRAADPKYKHGHPHATPWDKFWQTSMEEEDWLAWMPLRKDLSEKFSVDRAWEFYESVKENAYGFTNLIFGHVDTPTKNIPPPLDGETFAMMFYQYDNLMQWCNKITHNATKPLFDGFEMKTLVVAGFNHRLGTNCETMACLGHELQKRDLEFWEVAARPELDSFKYSFVGGNGKAMVCSSFIAEITNYALEGVIPAFEATEQTPRDNYQRALYDPEYVNEKNCPGGVMQTERGNYCQLMGPYLLVLDDYNTIPMYAHMNQNCTGQWPDYVRCPKENPMCC